MPDAEAVVIVSPPELDPPAALVAGAPVAGALLDELLPPPLQPTTTSVAITAAPIPAPIRSTLGIPVTAARTFPATDALAVITLSTFVVSF